MLGINTGYHLEPRRLAGVLRCRVLGCGKLFSPGRRSYGVQLGSHVHNMWIVLWIVSAARDGVRGERKRWQIQTCQKSGHDPSTG